MKPQDLLFILILVLLLFIKRNPKHFVWVGLACLILAMPLFQFWIFFTAERLIWYATGFFFSAILLFFLDAK